MQHRSGTSGSASIGSATTFGCEGHDVYLGCLDCSQYDPDSIHKLVRDARQQVLPGEFLKVEKANYPVTVLCCVLQVSRAGSYAFLRRPEPERVRRDQQLSVLVQASFEESRKTTYGSPRVLRDLVAWGECVSRKRVARLMRQSGLEARVRRRYKCTTMSDHDQPVAPNLLDRDFTAAGPNQRW